MSIYAIGDSHSSFFSGLGTREQPFMQPVFNEGGQINLIPQFKAIRLGPCTAYQLQRKIDLINFVTRDMNIEHDKLLFCFGEVDCRLHLPKRIIENGENQTDVVIECVERYFEVIKHYHSLNYNIIIWGVIGSNPPCLPYQEIYKRGTMEQRNNITIEFNNELNKRCELLNIPFVSIFDKMVDERLQTNPEYIMDNIHLSQTIMEYTLELFRIKKLI